MSAPSITAAVDRGLELRARIEALREELEACEARLREAALQGEQVELEDPERDGRQYLAKGSAAVVPVVLTADTIMQSFADGSATHGRLESIAGELLTQFYRPVRTWKLLPKGGKALRREAAAILEGRAADFVQACLARDKYGVPRSSIKVEWDRAEEVRP